MRENTDQKNSKYGHFSRRAQRKNPGNFTDKFEAETLIYRAARLWNKLARKCRKKVFK